jgi:uncharacterized protein
MPNNRLTERVSKSSTRFLPVFAATAISFWIVCEFIFRRGLVPHLSDLLHTGLGADAIAMAIGFPTITVLIAWWGFRVGIKRSDWDYSFSLRTIGAGLGGFVSYLVLYAAITALYSLVLGIQPSVGATGFGLSESPTWAIVFLVIANGIIVPITEELAWRGVIQTALTKSYGTYAAIGITAIAFVLKHILVDLSAPVFRVTSLVLLAFILCGLRARYGTTSSTVAHLLVNSLSTVALALM